MIGRKANQGLTALCVSTTDINVPRYYVACAHQMAVDLVLCNGDASTLLHTAQ